VPKLKPTDLLGDLLRERRLDREDVAIQLEAARASAEGGRFTVAMAELNGARMLLERMEARGGETPGGSAINLVVPEGGPLDTPRLARQISVISQAVDLGQFVRAHSAMNGLRFILITMRGRAEHPSQEPS
jgi:hypothetical protein